MLNYQSDEFALVAYNLVAADYAKNDPHGAERYPIALVWSCKILRNRKYIFSISQTGIMYEVTYNGPEMAWYVDRYKREYRRVFDYPDIPCIPDSSPTTTSTLAATGNDA